MNLSLILVVFWVVVAAGIFILDPPQLRIRIGDSSFSSGWVALFLALWNMLRWWSYRSARARNEAAVQTEQRLRRHERPAEDSAPERNPDFIFDEPPAPERKDAPPPG
jgi:hypothetical protein